MHHCILYVPYNVYFIVIKLINKNIEVVGLDKKNIENGYLKYSCSGEVNIEDIPYFMQNRKKTLLSNYTNTIIRIIIYILMLKILS